MHTYTNTTYKHTHMHTHIHNIYLWQIYPQLLLLQKWNNILLAHQDLVQVVPIRYSHQPHTKILQIPLRCLKHKHQIILHTLITCL